MATRMGQHMFQKHPTSRWTYAAATEAVGLRAGGARNDSVGWRHLPGHGRKRNAHPARGVCEDGQHAELAVSNSPVDLRNGEGTG